MFIPVGQPAHDAALQPSDGVNAPERSKIVKFKSTHDALRDLQLLHQGLDTSERCEGARRGPGRSFIKRGVLFRKSTK